MSDHAVEGILDTMLEKIKTMVDANSVIGKPISTPDGTTIIPISKLSYGFGSGGGDAQKAPQGVFGAGCGGGFTITRCRSIAP